MTENGETTTKHVETTAKETSFIDLPTRFDRWEPFAEVIATLVLALATVATAWSGYQSSRWGGEQSTSYSQAGALRTESTRASNQAGQLTQIDIGLFTNWVNAYAGGDERLINFYEKRFRDEFKPAFDAWVATDPANNPDAPKSPFAMPEYQVSLVQEADRLEVEATETFAKGQVANQTSDNYILNTVFLASVMFLGGIATRFKAMSARWVIILFSLLILVFGLYNILTYPII
ncbi:MAG TPA: hypothetical protein VMW34_10440 [Anaerolineales bacterium]|nr:hypothetical protein [Anaerolineales bacterium]